MDGFSLPVEVAMLPAANVCRIVAPQIHILSEKSLKSKSQKVKKSTLRLFAFSRVFLTFRRFALFDFLRFSQFSRFSRFFRVFARFFAFFRVFKRFLSVFKRFFAFFSVLQRF